MKKKLGYTRDDKQSLGNGTDDLHKDRWKSRFLNIHNMTTFILSLLTLFLSPFPGSEQKPSVNIDSDTGTGRVDYELLGWRD